MLEWGVFVELADPPKETGLLPLRGAMATRDRVVEAFRPFLNPALWHSGSLDQIPDRTSAGVLYLYGHAWLDNGDLRVARSTAQTLCAHDLLLLLHDRYPGRVLLVVDTCHAGALLLALQDVRPPGWMVVFASSADESAFSFTETGSRLSLALARAGRKLGERTGLDALDLYQAARDQLRRSEVVAAQSVSCWLDGEAIVLSPRPVPNGRSLPQPHIWFRALFVGLGSLLAMGVIAGASYYYGHVLVEIRVPPDVVAMTVRARITIHRSDLDAGTESPLRDIEVPSSGVLRVRIPAGNFILRFKAAYRDEGARAMNLHAVTAPTWTLSEKRIRWVLPDEKQVSTHAGMAYVPPTKWMKGVARDITDQPFGFWIDLHPPRMSEYVPWLRAAIALGEIDPLMTQTGATRARASAMTATGLDQSLGQLMKDLDPAFQLIDETVRRDQLQDDPMSARLPLLEEACEDCPALLTREEADQYCAARNMRVSTRSEWELAVRGVDGRAFPWGERFVKGRANVIGLPEKGETVQLGAVDAFRNVESPFGLWDTVGNAGDWVDTEGGYPQAFAGGNYRFNPEDATVVSLLPDTGEMAAAWPNTVRCVAADKP